MKPNEHANLLSIFFWIFAGIQSLMFLFIALYVIFFGVITAMVAAEGKPGSEDATLMFGIIIAVMVVILLIGLTTIVLNICAGSGLRKNKPWTKKVTMAASIGSLGSFLCGGILVLPFGIALGVYGLWFLTSGVADRFFSGDYSNNQPPNMYPPPPNQYYR